ncbi:MAG: Phycocyanobilin lyase subunit alpha [bacterium ADurb.Bin429]|nr:MAG: Phycocyanobilin lyase subunit alpha [bacterium ADurb.Bin429]
MSVAIAIRVALDMRQDTDLRRTAVQPLIGRLTDVNVHVRYLAIEALVATRDPVIVPALIPLMKDKEVQVSNYAINALGNLRDVRAVPPLLTLMLTGEGDSALLASEALRHIGKPAVSHILEAYWQTKETAQRLKLFDLLKQMRVPALAAFYADVFIREADIELRKAAAQALATMFDARAVPALLAATKDTDPELRQAAASALRHSRERTTTDTLLPLLHDPQGSVRIAAINALFERDDDRVMPALMLILNDGDPQVRTRVYVLLLAIQQDKPTALEFFLQAIQENDSEIRRFAVWGLELQYRLSPPIDRRRIITALLNLLDNADTGMRREMIISLREYTDSQVIEALITLVQHDESPQVRASAAQNLGRIGDDHAIEPLMRAIHDPVEWVRSEAKDALGRIGDRRAIRALQAIKDVGDQQDRQRTASALARLGVTEGITPPRGFTKAEWAIIAPVFGRYELDKEALTALQARQPKLTDTLKACLTRATETGFEQRIMQALVTMNAPGAADAIAAYYQHIRGKGGESFATEMLLRLKDPRAIEPMIEEIRRRSLQPGSDASGKIVDLLVFDDPRVTELLEALRTSEDVYIRYAVAGVLARRGDADALAFLLQPLDSGDIETYHAATKALGHSGNSTALDALLRELAQVEPGLRGMAAEAVKQCLAVNLDAEMYARVAPLLLAAADKEKKGSIRFSLLGAMAAQNDPRAVDGLIAVAQDARYATKKAIYLLVPYGGEKVVDALIKVLAEGNQEMREEAASQLGGLGDARAVPALLRAVREDTTRVRVKAIRSLGQLKAADATEPLVAALSEPGTRIQDAAAEALQATTGQAFGVNAKAWQAWWAKQRK